MHIQTILYPAQNVKILVLCICDLFGSILY